MPSCLIIKQIVAYTHNSVTINICTAPHPSSPACKIQNSYYGMIYRSKYLRVVFQKVLFIIENTAIYIVYA